MKNLKFFSLTFVIVFICSLEGYSQDVIDYQIPSGSAVKLLSTPFFVERLSPDKRKVVVLESSNSPGSTEYGKQFYHLAGIKFDAETHLPSNLRSYSAVSFQEIGKGETIKVNGLPEQTPILDIVWSPDSRYVAIVMLEKSGASLWLVDTDTQLCKRLLDRRLALPLVGEEFLRWHGASKYLICTIITSEKGGMPNLEENSKKPVIFENLEGRSVPRRAYQGLLTSEYDENLFDYLATGQLISVNLSGDIVKIGEPDILLDYDISPNGDYLMAHFVRKPYSYSYTVHRFPSILKIFNINSPLVQEKKQLRLDNVIRPQGRDAAYNVPRGFKWRTDQDASLIWIEAMDEGNPKTSVEFRDKVMEWKAPFDESPKVLTMLGDRFDQAYWINDTLAIFVEKWWEERRKRWLLVDPQQAILIDTLAVFSSESYLDNLGKPIWESDSGKRKLLYRDNSIFLSRYTYDSIDGSQPVLEKWSVTDSTFRRLWQSTPPFYESIVGWGDDYNAKKIIVSRQGTNTPDHLVMIDLDSLKEINLTDPERTFKEAEGFIIKKTLIYHREDGVKLKATLYYHKDSLEKKGKLPGLVYAYPIDHIDKDKAGEIFQSPYFYSGYTSLQKTLALEGIAILDYASFPVVAAKEGAFPNDNYLYQIEQNADAIVDAAFESGVVDTTRMAIMGHSYGAFMVANLLTHTNIFKTGIALSGAYNRSLTPFGFQREYRTYWDIQELYHQISPFQHADKLKHPILLVHGEEDDNAGTDYQQSVNYYVALKGLGKQVRFVSLPYEGHTYQLEESRLHLYWELERWVQEFLKTSK